MEQISSLCCTSDGEKEGQLKAGGGVERRGLPASGGDGGATCLQQQGRKMIFCSSILNGCKGELDPCVQARGEGWHRMQADEGLDQSFICVDRKERPGLGESSMAQAQPGCVGWRDQELMKLRFKP